MIKSERKFFVLKRDPKQVRGNKGIFLGTFVLREFLSREKCDGRT